MPYTASARCGGADYELEDDGTVTVINSYLEGDKYSTANGSIYCDNDGTGQCHVRFSKFQPWGDYKILATDYDTYAVVWSCSNFLFFNYQLSWVLGRDIDVDSDSLLENYIYNQTTLTADDFVKDDNTNCPAQASVEKEVYLRGANE